MAAIAWCLSKTISTVTPGIKLKKTSCTNATSPSGGRLGLVVADASFPVAVAMGLVFRDNTVAANSVYEYHIRIYSADTTQTRAAWLATIDTRQTQSLPALPTAVPKRCWRRSVPVPAS